MNKEPSDPAVLPGEPVGAPESKLVVYSALGYPGRARADKPAIPATWDDVVRQAVEVREAGASIVHLHGPHDSEGRILPEEWARLAQRIRAECDILIDFGQAGAPLAQRRALVEADRGRPDFMGVSLTNHDYRRHDQRRGDHDVYYEHHREELVEYATMLRAAGVKPNWEVWHLGGLWNLHFLADQGLIDGPVWLNLLFGTPGGVWSPATVPEISHRLDHVPSGSECLVAPRGVGGPLANIRMLTFAIIRGAHVRCGAQDVPDYLPDRPARDNKEIVQRVARIAGELGRPVATPADVRTLLALP